MNTCVCAVIEIPTQEATAVSAVLSTVLTG